MAELKVNICGIEFTNPVMPAAGPPTKDGGMCRAAAEGGAGAIVTKTISTTPAEVPRPCMAEVKGGFLNTELWSELPKEQWIEKEYKIAKATKVPVIISIGYTAQQIGELAQLVKPYADVLELSTHYVGNDVSPIVEAFQAAKREVDLPVWVKLSPHPNISEIAMALEQAGVDGLVMINSFGPTMGINVETGLPFMGSKEGYGWLSGPAIKPLAIRCIYDAAKVVKIPIIGVGGISTGRDAAEMFMAGASAVQVCTAAILQGPKVYNRIVAELNEFLDSHSYSSVEEIIALTAKKLSAKKKINENIGGETLKPILNHEKCTLCGLCEKSCAYNAIKLKDKLTLDYQQCFGCGLCVTRCRTRAISL